MDYTTWTVPIQHRAYDAEKLPVLSLYEVLQELPE
jgi:hypothetical protein